MNNSSQPANPNAGPQRETDEHSNLSDTTAESKTKVLPDVLDALCSNAVPPENPRQYDVGLSALLRLKAKTNRQPWRVESSTVVPVLPFDASPTVLPPRFGRFLVQEELGRGGFGIVVKAFDTVLNRTVALKVPKLENLDQIDQQFDREGRAAAALDHPNIVPIYDAGKIGPVPFISFAYCPGKSLSAWLKESNDFLPPMLTARWLSQLADGIHHAHSRQILHRDLKPGNVLLVPIHDHVDDPEQCVLKITDFGLAKPLDADANKTQSNVVKGTLAYMSPEQTRGGKIDGRSDVYGLGSILFEMLTRRPPFQGDSAAELINQICHSDVIPPRRLRSSIPRDLETICMKCLEKDPSRRYQTARDLQNDLNAFVAGKPIKARPISTLGQLVRWAGRQPLAAGLATTLIAGMLIAFSVMFILWQWASRNAELALDEKKRLEVANIRLVGLQREANAAQQRAERLFSKSLEAVSTLTTLAYDQQEAPGMQQFASKSIMEADALYTSLLTLNSKDKQLRIKAANAARMMAANSMYFGRVDEAFKHYDRAENMHKILNRDFPGDDDQLAAYAHVLVNYGYALRGKQRPDNEKRLEQAKQLLQEILQRKPNHLAARRSLSNLLANFAHWDFTSKKAVSAKKNAEQALDLARKLMQQPGELPDRIAVGFATDVLVRLAFEEKDYARAHALVDESIAALSVSNLAGDKLWAMDRIAMSFELKSGILRAENKPLEAIHYAERAHKAFLEQQRAFPESLTVNQRTFSHSMRLGRMYVSNNMLSKGVDTCTSAIDLKWHVIRQSPNAADLRSYSSLIKKEFQYTLALLQRSAFKRPMAQIVFKMQLLAIETDLRIDFWKCRITFARGGARADQNNAHHCPNSDSSRRPLN